MAAIEFTDDTRQRIERIGSADLVVGVAGTVARDDIRARAQQVVRDLGSAAPSLRLVFAWPDATPQAAALNGSDLNGSDSPLTLLPFSAPLATGELWSGVSANQRAVLSLAASLNAKAC
ncbi:MAG: hypothetical protein WBD46_02940, partial [Acidobacteriaceae bacterium]